ncbi:MAG: ABC transporter ATP-binding protein [Clostridia bacterium]|nr:ABC transporter ATP-binding protein [Clostridia bacterium]
MKKNKKDKKNKKPRVGFFKCVKKTIPTIIGASPWLFSVGCVIIVVQSILAAAQIYVLEFIFNGVTAVSEAGGGAVLNIVLWLAVYAGSFVFSALLGQIANRTDTDFLYRAENRQTQQRFDKIAKIAPILFEDTDRLDDIEKSSAGADSARSLLNTLKQIVLYHIPYFAVTSVYLFQRDPWLVASLLMIFLPTLLYQYLVKKIYRDKEDKAAPDRRLSSHYVECATSEKYFKETRILGGFRYFFHAFHVLWARIMKLDRRVNNKDTWMFFFAGLLTFAGNMGVYYMLFRFLLVGRITMGEFAAVFTSVNTIEDKLHNLFYGSFASASRDLPFIENYVRYLDFPENDGEDVELPYDIGIDVRDVTFSYPNTEEPAVRGVSFSVKPKETVAIVGENGSGKSTLIKLLIGYYRPDGGDVRICGRNTKEISFESVARRLSAVYQRYPHYPLTLKENLIIGQYEKESTDDNLREACAMAGFSPDEEWLPHGLETMLSREFDDGVGLSGGQAQRVSIARGFYRDSSIIILDEPTAAIDPIEEARIYGRFAELSRDKTSFIVTHRLGSVRLADRIIMMKDGKIAETGTHDELMAKDGEYKKMFDSQRQWYEDEA